MSLYLLRQLRLQVSTEQALTNPLISKGNSEERLSGITELSESIDGYSLIPNAASDLEIELGPSITTGRLFYIESDQDLTIKFDDVGNTGYDLKVPSTSNLGIWCMDVEFTAVYITVPGATDANVYFAIVGT